MAWLSSPWITLGLGGWLLGLTVAIILLWPRVQRLREDYQMMQQTLQRIDSKLDGLAQARQVEDLAAKVAEAIDVRRAARSKPGKHVGIAFEGAATVQGAVVGGAVEQLKQGAP